MRGVGGVAEEDDVAARPALTFNAPEVQPCGAADEMRRVRLERMAVEIFGEERLARGDALVLAHAVEAETRPGLLRTFDDEGRAVRCEAVGVRPDPAVLRILEGEGEGVEDLARAEPHELVLADVDIDAERFRRRIAEARVRTVGGDNK